MKPYISIYICNCPSNNYALHTFPVSSLSKAHVAYQPLNHTCLIYKRVTIIYNYLQYFSSNKELILSKVINSLLFYYRNPQYCS